MRARGVRRCAVAGDCVTSVTTLLVEAAGSVGDRQPGKARSEAAMVRMSESEMLSLYEDGVRLLRCRITGPRDTSSEGHLGV